MQNLTPANGTEVASFAAVPSASMFDVVMDEAHQVVDALRVQIATTPAPTEKLDNTPSFVPSGMSGPRF